MAKRVMVSLANKCQLLFGAAVVLIIAAALGVAWVRMTALADRQPMRRAQDFANAWLADQVQLPGAWRSLDDLPAMLDPGDELLTTMIPADDFDEVDRDGFLGKAIRSFVDDDRNEKFGVARDRDGQRYYRYARAVRRSELTIQPAGAQRFSPGVGEAALTDPVELVFAIDLRDRDAELQRLINVICLSGAGLIAGLLAIAAFWYITTRIILSPVRVLRDYAGKVTQGDTHIRSDINTGDEFEQLSDMFNAMLDRVRANEKDLRLVNKTLDLKLNELAETNISLFEANKLKGEFLANVSHELRTPLNSIVGFAEVLKETLANSAAEPSDAKRARYCDHIITGSRRLLELINELLDLAKIEAGRMEVRVEAVSLPDVAEGLTALIRPQADRAGVTLVVQLEPGLPTLETDAGKLQQIVFNFLSNAVKFTPDGGVVTLAVRREPSARTNHPGHVRISVSDTGPGIAEEDRQRVFEKFVQLDAVETRQHGGTGLGLTISRQLAQLLQGTIELDSTPGRGATFTLRLPVVATPIDKPLMPDLVETGG
ncbi:MAG: HAMP domain-containing sensor histidine kinase [Planctomycetota bacterium]